MKFIGKYSLSFYIKILLLVIMAGTAMIVVFLPWVVEIYLKIDYGTYADRARTVIQNGTCISRARTILLAVLYPCGICAFLIENELRKIFKTLELKNPFVQRNAKSLNRMGFLLIVIFVMFIVKIILLNTLMTMIFAVAIIILALFCFVLADVFKQAVIFKQENDLTI